MAVLESKRNMNGNLKRKFIKWKINKFKNENSIYKQQSSVFKNKWINIKNLADNQFKTNKKNSINRLWEYELAIFFMLSFIWHKIK